MDTATLTATHRLALGACALLATLHLLLRLANADWLANGVFLVPGYTVTRPWQVVTANLFEDSSPNLVAALVCVCAASALLLPRWGEAELARFLLLTSTLQACVSWACMVGLYILFRSEHFLFAQLGGLTGLLGSLSVAFAQVSSDGPGPHKALALAHAAASLHLLLSLSLSPLLSPLLVCAVGALALALTLAITLRLTLANYHYPYHCPAPGPVPKANPAPGRVPDSSSPPEPRRRPPPPRCATLRPWRSSGRRCCCCSLMQGECRRLS